MSLLHDFTYKITTDKEYLQTIVHLKYLTVNWNNLQETIYSREYIFTIVILF